MPVGAQTVVTCSAMKASLKAESRGHDVGRRDDNADSNQPTEIIRGHGPARCHSAFSVRMRDIESDESSRLAGPPDSAHALQFRARAVTRINTRRVSIWLSLSVVLAVSALLVAAWQFFPRIAVSVDELTAWLSVHRHGWYALPAVMFAFVVLGLAMVPVIMLIAATGIVFGPLLGPVYAMAGCLASASTGFAIGRWMGLRRTGQLGGERMTRVMRVVKRDGTLAVFLARKIPAPFTIVNIVIGASMVRFRDFIVGTLLGMGAFVVGLAGFGYKLTDALRDPSLEALMGAAAFVAVPLTLAVLINRAFVRMRPVE